MENIVEMDEQTKSFIEQFKRDSKEILDYQNQTKIKCYKNMKTRELVLLDEAQSYVCEHLGIHIVPIQSREKEQQEFLKSTTEWYFSGNWIEKEVKENEL